MTAVEPAPRTRGGQPGNRNALKSGRHTAQMRALRREARVKLQKIKAAIALVLVVAGAS